MSAGDKKRNLRTQGRFSNPSSSSENKQKGSMDERSKQTKRKNASAEECDERMTQSNREIDKESIDSAGQGFSNVPHGISKVTYQENSHYDITPFEEPKPPEEIKEEGLKILSTTEYGESKVFYYPQFLDMKEAYDFFDKFFCNIDWRQMNIVVRGREFLQPRLVAWFGPFAYSYSGVVLKPQEMTDDILEIKEKMEKFLAEKKIYANFNSVLLNLYRHGNHSVAWHSDDELSMGVDPTIASISLGEIRKFEMRRKPKRDDPNEPPVKYYADLRNGSLFIMDGVMQVDWQHRVPKDPRKEVPRINLTFRTVYKDERLLKVMHQ